MSKVHEKNYTFSDNNGNSLIVYRHLGKVNFTLSHSEIEEGSARKEFEGISISVSASTEPLYDVAAKLYEIIGDSFVLSEDPIRDGRNYLCVDHPETNEFYLTIGRDLANNLNRPTQTNVEVSGAKFDEFYRSLNQETTEFVKKLPH